MVSLMARLGYGGRRDGGRVRLPLTRRRERRMGERRCRGRWWLKANAKKRQGENNGKIEKERLNGKVECHGYFGLQARGWAVLPSCRQRGQQELCPVSGYGSGLPAKKSINWPSCPPAGPPQRHPGAPSEGCHLPSAPQRNCTREPETGK